MGAGTKGPDAGAADAAGLARWPVPSNTIRRAERSDWRRRLVAGIVAAAMSGASGGAAATEAAKASWRHFMGSADSAGFSPLAQITRANLGRLSVAWRYPTSDSQSYTFSPIVVDRVMYVLAKDAQIVALDAGTGRELWSRFIDRADGKTRGLSYWESPDRTDRRILFVADEHLWAFDAQTGEPVISFGVRGAVDLLDGISREPRPTRVGSRGPGRIFEDLLILGSSPGEDYGSPPGDIRAYDVRTGKLRWTFHTIPRPGEFGYETWPRDAWKYVGGANNWGDMSLDEARGIAYIPTGSPTYDFYGVDRAGDNLFGNSILALDARTGKRLWHFQTIHHDLGDYDLASAPQLVTVRHKGKPVDVVAVASKIGFLYVLDRVTGAPIWPIVEKPVPRSTTPGELDSPTQPFPTKPPAFARQKFTAADINPYLLTPQERTKWVRFIKDARNDGLFTPPERGRNTLQMPGHSGGSGLLSTSANPAKGLVYVVSFDSPTFMRLNPDRARATGDEGYYGPAVSGILGCESVCGDGAEQYRARSANMEAAAAAPPPKALVTTGQKVYQDNCAACHGPQLRGMGAIPGLTGVVARRGEPAVRAVIRNGQGQMPAFGFLRAPQVHALVAYLGTVRKAEAGTEPADPDPRGPNMPARLYSGYGFAPALIKPPWHTLTAYDLNRGDIKWQVPYGEAIGPGLPKGNNFGMLQFHGAKSPVVVTASGLLFSATVDREFRAFDQDTGKVLWSYDLPDRAMGVPAIYEVDGRQFITISVRGSYMAFALPAQSGGGDAER